MNLLRPPKGLAAPPPPAEDLEWPSWNRLFRGPFVLRGGGSRVVTRGVLMAGARFLGMGLGLVGWTWASRCLGPRNVGISGMILSLVTPLPMLLDVLHPTVLIRHYKNAAEGEDRFRWVRLSMSVRLTGAVLVCLAALAAVGRNPLPADYRFAEWFFIPLVFLTLLQPLWVFQAAEKQGLQFGLALAQPALAAALYGAFFKPGMTAGSDLAVNTAALAVLLALYWWGLYRFVPFRGSPVGWGGAREALALVWESRWVFLAGLATYAYTTLEQPLLGFLRSLEELGKYRTAVTLVSAVQNTLAILPTLLYPRFLEWRKQGEEVLWSRQWKLVSAFSVVGVVGSACAFLFLPLVYPILFGAAFEGAALPCAILLTAKFMVLLNGIFGWGLLTDPEYDRRVWLCFVAAGAFSLACNLVFIPKHGMTAAALTNLGSESLLLLSFLFLAARRIKFHRMG